MLPEEAHLNIGDTRCLHHRGLVRVNAHKCCGNSKTTNRAIILCAVQGEIEIEVKACDYICRHYMRSS